jgi:hypothetical protein
VPGSSASTLIEQEALALLTRLDRLRPFALNETMIPAAAPSPAALSLIESQLLVSRRRLRCRVGRFVQWLRGQGRRLRPDEQQRRFALLRLEFNAVLSQYDLFAEVITQRSERENGVWLSGLDTLGDDALRLGVPGVDVPPVVCYLARGPGAAIRRARTRLPGGDENPVAIIRVPRERMIGQGIASSLIHEVGHQAAALLCLVEPLRAAIRARRQTARRPDRFVWSCWERWISEILADFWSVGKLGIGAPLGLIGVVSLPRWAVFRPSADDPHPVPWIRVQVSCAIGAALYPHPQWSRLSRSWRDLYPIEHVTASYGRTLEHLAASIPEFVELLVAHRPSALRGRSLRELMPTAERRPERLRALWEQWRRSPIGPMSRVAPSLAFAVIGQARATGAISATNEARLLSELLTLWALRSTLDISAICAERTAPALRRVS